MSAEPLALMQRHRQTGVLIDTNILLLLFVGSFDRALIPRFKRTVQFTAEDYDLATRLYGFFARVVTIPNILTEVSNLAGQLKGYLKPGYFEAFARGIALLDERYVPSAEISRMQEFGLFALTTTGILSVARLGYLVLTDDFKLAGYLETNGLAALNFNHLRFAETAL